MINKYFIVGPYFSSHPSLKANTYKLCRRKASEYAKSIGRELAEGPTLLILDNHYGPVELWPLVLEEVN